VGNGEVVSKDVQSYRDLIAWQRAYAVGLEIYRATMKFPDHERFGLAGQLRRGGVSVASNIAEGYGRGSRLEYVRFLKISRGALFEVETQLRFASDLGYLDEAQSIRLTDLVNDTARVLSGLIRSLEEIGNG
jgi:four helix bundle protein